MGLVIGMDEAGYGPNLGPLVVTATAWEVPDRPGDADFWGAFADVVDQGPCADGARLHVADSKDVYSPARGLESLERSVLATLRLGGHSPESFTELRRTLCPAAPADEDGEPWFNGCDLPLPHAVAETDWPELAARWKACCEETGIRLRAVCSDVVLTQRFNRLTREHNSKGLALSRISLALLRHVWDPLDPEATLIVADKHGGRNRYDELLDEILDGPMIFRLEEGRPRSCYKVGSTEIRFQMKAEVHFPVAVSSMISKYVRELSMELFNRFWLGHIPELKPTKGYPTDARRFRQDIAAVQKTLGIGDDVLWRER